MRIYTTRTCPSCMRARRLLQEKNVPSQEIDVSWDDQARTRLLQSTGLRTVAAALHRRAPRRGSDELHALEARGELDPLLQ